MFIRKLYATFLILLLAVSLIPLKSVKALSFNLTAIPECGFIMLKWDRVPDAVRYYVYRGPGEGQEYPIPLTDFAITDTFYKDTTDLVENQKYCYFIKAVGKDDKEFLQSIEACATFTCKEEIPTPPEIAEEDCKMVLKYQVDNKVFWKNDIPMPPMDVAPIIRENRVNLMARYLADQVKAAVGWDGTTRTVTITTLDGVVIKMQIGNPIATINNVPTPIDPNNSQVFPFIENGRTYTGLRFISYNLGATGPTDITWVASTKTAVLTFKDPVCKWVCGCIRKLPPSSLTNNIPQYGFFENCNNDKPQYTKIPLEMKDRVLGLTFLEYMKKYPNQDYWCVELRVDEYGNVVGWRARPDQYPNCCKPKPPTDCKWVCGCVQKWTEAPNGNISIFFSKDCKDSTDFLSFIVPATLKDSNLGITWLEYFRKFANQKYWCVELCIGPNNNIVAWKATPEKYPNCCETAPLECKWVPGYITNAVQTPGTTLWTVSFALNCKEQQMVDLQIDGSLLDMNLSILLADYIKKYPNHKYWCVEFCIDANRKIVQWKATPEKYPNCCGEEEPPSECRWICGCILKAGPSAASNNWLVAFSPDCNPNSIIDLQIPGNLADINLNITMESYIKKYVDMKYWCVNLCIDKNKNIVKWAATPEKYPKCCEEKPTKFICACIVRMTIQPDAAGFYQVYLKVNCSEDPTSAYDLMLNFPASQVDENLHYTVLEYYNSISGEPPKSLCIEVEIDPITNSVINWWAFPDRQPCCEVKDKGRILAYVPFKCVEGTTFVISDLNGRVVWKGQATNEGILDTDCVLECTKIYIVTPKNEKCTFSPASQEVKVPCCPDKAEVRFKCECDEEPEGGRVKIFMPKECVNGTTIYIYDAETGEIVKKVTRSDWVESFFDVMCTLPCPKVYKIVPKNEKCNFDPVSLTVKVPCCPDIIDVKFGCDCEQTTDGGRIVAYFPKQCIEGTKVIITDIAGLVVWSGTPNDNGTVDTGCKLKCSAGYIITPKNEKCKFNPEFKEVKILCCPEVTKVEFGCECAQPERKGRIVGTVIGNCGENTMVVIYDENGKSVWYGPTNANGYFESSAEGKPCVIPCPGTYKIVPSKGGCKISPETMSVTLSARMCCDNNYVAKVDFKCECKSEQTARIIGTIFGDGCNANTYVVIYDSAGNQVWSGQTNDNGYFETSPDGKPCVLKCPGKYKVVPARKGCSFSPESQEVTFSERECCEDKQYKKIDFKCYCQRTGISQPDEPDPKPCTKKNLYPEKMQYLINDIEPMKIKTN